MQRRTLSSSLPVALLLTALSCKDSEPEQLNVGASDTPDSFTAGDFRITGQAQKGPFVNGTSVRISELTEQLVPTGRSFDATILDDSGRFELPEIRLESPYVRLSADGFYFNEVTGSVSDARLELTALADIREAASINVNVMSHLERARAEHLIGTGMTFALAKQQAQRELLAIFNIEADRIGAAETLDIAGQREGDTALLALSLILQGSRSVGEMSELMSNISTDLRTDGILDSATSGSALLNEATLVSLDGVRDNLKSRYESLGLTATVGDFEAHVRHFKETTDFEFTKHIEYPETGEYGINLLATEESSLSSWDQFSLKAILPTGTSLRVKLHLESGEWGINAFHDGNWDFRNYLDNQGQEFWALVPEPDMSIRPSEQATMRLDVYENGATVPTRVMPFEWRAPEPNCTSLSDCNAQQTCDLSTGGHCVDRCTESECGESLLCDPELWLCRDPNRTVEGCPLAEVVEEGQCVAQTCTADADCYENFDCGSEGWCVAPACSTENDSCPAGYVCFENAQCDPTPWD